MNDNLAALMGLSQRTAERHANTAAKLRRGWTTAAAMCAAHPGTVPA